MLYGDGFDDLQRIHRIGPSRVQDIKGQRLLPSSVDGAGDSAHDPTALVH